MTETKPISAHVLKESIYWPKRFRANSLHWLVVTIEEFSAKINHNLDTATFEGKRRILDMLDVRGTLAIENDERVLYVSCLLAPQQVSLALISSSSNNHNRHPITISARLVIDVFSGAFA